MKKTKWLKMRDEALDSIEQLLFPEIIHAILGIEQFDHLRKDRLCRLFAQLYWKSKPN